MASCLRRNDVGSAGLFDPYIIRETRQVLPQPNAGFLAVELEREQQRVE